MALFPALLASAKHQPQVLHICHRLKSLYFIHQAERHFELHSTLSPHTYRTYFTHYFPLLIMCRIYYYFNKSPVPCCSTTKTMLPVPMPYRVIKSILAKGIKDNSRFYLLEDLMIIEDIEF